MKLRLFILTLLPLMVLSCSINIGEEKSFDEVLPSSEEVMLSSKTRAAEDDFQVHLDDAMLYAKMIEPKKEVESIVPYVQEGDTLMYYVYYNDGWKLISGDKRIQPELINEPTGKRTPEELCDGEQITVQEYVEFLSALKEYPYADKDTQYVEFWNKITRKHIKKEEPVTRTVWEPTLYNYEWLYHKIENDPGNYISDIVYPENSGNITNTQWGQGSPWNTKIPENGYGLKAPLGCVSVAVSQLLYYLYQEKDLSLGLYEYVSLINGYYIDVTLTDEENNHYTYPKFRFIPALSKNQYVQNSSKWNNMALTSSGSNDGVYNAQDLMLVVGEGVHMDYTVIGSGSTDSLAQTYLDSIGVACSLVDYSKSSVINSIRSGFPLYVGASQEDNGPGHAWLIDGYGRKVYTTYENCTWEIVYPSDPGFTPVYGDEYLTPEEVAELTYTVYDGLTGYFPIEHFDSEFLMMNWGYNGTGRGTEYYDAEFSAYWTIGDATFSTDKRIIFNYSFSTR